MYVIAEVGQAHEGSLAMALSFIQSAASAGASAIKFQMHIAYAESSEHEPFRIPLTIQDKSRYEYWERMEFTKHEWIEISKKCEECQIDLIISPFSVKSLETISLLNVARIKVASGEINNLLLLDAISDLKKPVIYSTGLSHDEEIETINEYAKENNTSYAILQCTSQYPTRYEDIGLNCIPEFIEKYKCEVGLSDHSGSVYTGLASVCFGASILEVHVTYSKDILGPDASTSLTFDDLTMLVNGCAIIEQIIKNPVSKIKNTVNKEYRDIFGKSLAVNRDISAGEVLKTSDLESKKPFGMGVPAGLYKTIIGRKLNKSLKSYDFIQDSDLD